MKRKLCDPQDSNNFDNNSNSLIKESYRSTIGRCLTNARDATGRSALNLSILRKNTESMVFRHTITQAFSSHSKSLSNYLIDEVEEVFTIPFEITHEDSPNYLDNVYWHSTEVSVTKEEWESLM